VVQSEIKSLGGHVSVVLNWAAQPLRFRTNTVAVSDALMVKAVISNLHSIGAN
jgi:hypothetical protein